MFAAIRSWRRWWVAGALVAAVAAQTPVDDEALEQRCRAACDRLREAGQLVSSAELAVQLARPARAEVPLLELRREPLAVADLRDRIAPSACIVGQYYLCAECDQWHFDAASGFWLARDGVVATCAHVVPPEVTMREAYVVVADLAGEVWPVQRVLAADVGADVVVLQTPARERTPLPLRPDVRDGEPVHCLSHPDHRFGFFSTGVVARHWLEREPGAAAPRPWLHVTCDFARGSSGGPIVDASGNLVGIAQATTTVVYDEAAEPIDTQMVFKTAVPAAALRTLLVPLPPASAAPEGQR